MFFIKYFSNNGRILNLLYAIILAVLILIMSSLYTLYDERMSSTIISLSRAATNKKIAIVYGVPNYHMEVTSTVSCLLHSLGYYVVVYIDNRITTHLPTKWDDLYNLGKKPIFTQNWKNECKSLYGHCVSQWLNVGGQMDHVKNAAVIVFITYPMKVRPWYSLSKSQPSVEDKNSFNLFKSLQFHNNNDNLRSNLNAENQFRNISKLVRSDPSVILITHNSHDIITYNDYFEKISKIVPPNRLHYMFLSEHTKIEAEKYRESNRKNIQNLKIIPIEYFMPIMPMSFVHTIQKNDSNNNDNNNKVANPIFSIQGSFGGKSHFRRNLTDVMQCLKYLEDKGRSQENNISQKLDIDFIGRVSEPFDWNIGKQLHRSRVRFLSNLEPKEFYRAISKSKFLIAAIDNKEYFTFRASSSIPAAFIANVPIIATSNLLNLYPCLRNTKIHKKINLETKCESIEAALKLSSEEYLEAKNELLECGNIYIKHAKYTFTKIIDNI